MLRPSTPLSLFENDLRQLRDPIASFREGVIGADTTIVTPFGAKKLVYADYVASGRALRHIEDFVMAEVLPYYANSHTEQSFCGGRMTQMREEARQVIAEKCGANTQDHAVIFGGSGATTGLNQLVHLFGIKDDVAADKEVFVLVGPYEHHSNLLPWRESGATVVQIGEAEEGGPDMGHMRAVLKAVSHRGAVIGAFSAASNVTGVCTEPGPITALIKEYGGKVVWDYAGAGPYLQMTMSPDGHPVDAIVVSPHKFVGGPGSSGVLIVRRDAVTAHKPSRPGGGTVAFVNSHLHDYVTRLEQREEGGTPNVIGDIRAALAMIVKDVVGQARINEINQRLSARAFEAWAGLDHLHVLAPARRARLPIFSFVPLRVDGQRVCYKAFTTALSDHFGIQARGGCSCAGPYVHDLMSIDGSTSAQLRGDILAGNEENKPGFVRLNLSYLMSDETVGYILDSIPVLLDQMAKEEV